MNKWLKEGKQTQVTSLVHDVASGVEGEGLDLVHNISDYVNSIYCRGVNRFDLFRKRSADDILSSELVTECSDAATLFRTLCIARNIPAVWVDTIDESWLSDPAQKVEGHVFVDVFTDGWHTVDPASDHWLHDFEDYSIGGRKFIVLGKGLDAIDVGVETFDKLQERINKKFRIQ